MPRTPTVRWSTRQKRAAFKQELGSAAAWIIRARYLKDASARLNWEAPGNGHLVWIDMMMIGLAIEALLKATMILRGQAPCESQKNGQLTLSKEFRSHDLSKLAKGVACDAFRVTDTEDDLLEKLSEFVVWTGRYPGPIRDEQMRPVWITAAERAMALDFFDRLHKLIA